MNQLIYKIIKIIKIKLLFDKNYIQQLKNSTIFN